MAMELHWKTLKKLILRDHVLPKIKPKLIGPIQGPVPAPAVASNTPEGIDGIIQLQRMARFVAGSFDAKNCWSVNIVSDPCVSLAL